MRRFSKISLTSEEIFGEETDAAVPETLLAFRPLRFTLALLSRAGLTLADATYAEMPQVQADLARGSYLVRRWSGSTNGVGHIQVSRMCTFSEISNS